MGARRRRLLYQSTHSRVAYSTASKERQGPRLWIASAVNRPLIASARALLELSLTLPTDGSMPAPTKRSVYRRAKYCLRSSGRRNTILHGCENSVECLCRRLPVQRLARSAVEGRGHSSKIVHAVSAQIRAFREVLSQQPVRILVRPPLPG